jgi:predicted nucleic acid-binding protein
VTLPDSSAWIEYLRGTGSPLHHRLASAIGSGEQLATTGLVVMEVLAGGRDELHVRELGRLLGRTRLLRERPPADHERAAAIYRACRRAGFTVRRLSDCLIAAVAMREGASVLHRDADFDAMAEIVDLPIVRVG